MILSALPMPLTKTGRLEIHECIRKEAAVSLQTWAGKDQASFAELLAALRADSLAELKEKYLSTPGIPPGIHKFLKPLEYLIALAA